MAAILGQRQQIGIKETGSTTNVPNNDRAKLMYYLSCMCSVLDLSNEPGLRSLIDYKNYWRLDAEDEAALLALCIALNPLELNDKCISVMPEGIPGSRNRFLELSSTETTFVASSSVLIAGQQRQVSKIMLYKLSWIKDNYLSPLERFTNRLRSSNAIGYSRGSAGSYSGDTGCCCVIL